MFEVKKFISNCEGSVIPMVGITFLILTTAVAGAVDYTNAVTLKRATQSALDSAVLSCAKSNNPCNSDVFTENLGDRKDDFVTAPTVSLERDGDRVDGEVKGEVKTIIFKMASKVIGGLDINFSVKSSATNSSSSTDAEDNLAIEEIILVLDVSDSMKGKPLEALKVGTADFLNRIFDAGNPKVTLLPYAAGIPFPVNGGFDRYLAGGAPKGWDGCMAPEGYEMLKSGEMATDGSLKPLNLGSRKNGRGDTVPFCPPSASEAMFFSDDRAALLDRVASLEMGYGTATYSALNWAWRALEDEKDMPFRDGVESTAAKRAVILISDGMPKIMRGHDDKAAPGADVDERAQSMTLAACDVLKASPDTELYTALIEKRGSPNKHIAAKNIKACAPDISSFWLIQNGKIPEAMDEMAGRMMKPEPAARARLVN